MRSRQTDRAATIVGARDRHDAGGDRGRRTAAGAAGRMRRIPGIAARSPSLGLGDALGAELRRVGAAEHDHAGAQPAPHHQIASAHVCTPVTNAHLVCRLLLQHNNPPPTPTHPTTPTPPTHPPTPPPTPPPP